MINKSMFSSNRDDWETPQELFDELDAEFRFTLDAAANENNHKCPVYFTESDNALVKNWGGQRVFCNPPYGKQATGDWTQKCWQESQKPNTTVVLLIPARTDRASFHKYIWNQPGVEVRFLKGRVRFEIDGEKQDAAPFPSMVVIFRGTEAK